jgi:hypothetical protein
MYLILFVRLYLLDVGFEVSAAAPVGRRRSWISGLHEVRFLFNGMISIGFVNVHRE